MDSTKLSETFWGLITPEMVPVCVAVYGICLALKRANFFSDRFIPMAALGLGIALELAACAVMSRTIIADCVIRGIVCGMGAVFAANIAKQIKGDTNSN